MQLAAFLLIAEDYMLPCLTKSFFGIDCPGCGIQRSLVFLIKGDFDAAFHMYPGIFPLLALVLFAITGQFIKFKYDTQVKVMLGILSAAVILLNFFFKMNNLIH